MTTLGGDQPATVAILLRQRGPDGRPACTAQCLCAVGSEEAGCGCACDGTWHGALASAVVPGTVRRASRPAADGPVLDGFDELLDQVLPVDG